MKDLSLHILDIMENSMTAGASLVELSLVEQEDKLVVTIRDNGAGISPEMLPQVTDPFTTSRLTRPVGLGLPLFKLAATQTGGTFSIQSRLGEGTSVEAVFVSGHIDAPPIGDITGTLITAIQGHPEIDFSYSFRVAGADFTFNTGDVRATLQDVPLNNPDVLAWLTEYINENVHFERGNELEID